MESFNLYDEPYWSWLKPLAPYFEDPEVTCLIANGKDRLYVEKRFYLQSVQGSLEEAALPGLADALAALSQGEDPHLLQARLPSGEQLVLVRDPMVRGVIHMAIHRPHGNVSTLESLVDQDVVPLIAARFLAASVAGRRGILIASPIAVPGAMALDALCGRIDSTERVIVLENSSPLRFEHSHRVSLQLDPSSQEQRQKACQAATALRPDRLILGEIDSTLARWYLETAPTLSSSMAAIRAADPCTAVLYLEAMATAQGLPMEASQQLSTAGFSLIVTLGRLADGRMSIVRITEVTAKVGERFRDIFVTAQADDEQASVPVLVPTGLVPNFLPTLAPFGVALDPSYFSCETHGLPQPHGFLGEFQSTAVAPRSVQNKQPFPEPEPEPEYQPPPTPYAPLPTMAPVAERIEDTGTGNDPGWEVEVMAKRVTTHAANDMRATDVTDVPRYTGRPKPQPPPAGSGAFAALLKAKQSEKAKAQAPENESPTQGFSLEPPPTPSRGLTDEEIYGSTGFDEDIKTDPGR